MREMIEVTMPKAKVKPSVATYASLISRLRMEGDCVAARNVVEVDMPEAGLEPDDKTREILGFSSTGDIMRLFSQKHLCSGKQGE